MPLLRRMQSSGIKGRTDYFQLAAITGLSAT